MIPGRTFDEQRDRNTGTNVLIVDDEELVRKQLTSICEGVSDVQVLTASSVSEALSILAKKNIQVVLLDKNIKLANGLEDNGIEAIPEMLQLKPHLQILMISGSHDTQDIVKAVQLGALGYVTKDSDPELLCVEIKKAIRIGSLILSKARFEKNVEKDDLEISGTSEAIIRMRALLPQLSETDHPVLLLGESGTGKTTYAKAIHKYRSHYLKQPDKPFVQVNISALQPTLIERELFGSESGAFTGAQKGIHAGFFELASGGIIFLDEIGDVSLEVQKKLLEVIQEGTFYRVGGNKRISTSFKLICATNKNLYEMVKRKEFREDLYWRIAAFPVELPSLSSRTEDIPLIISAILPRISKKSRVHVTFEELPKDFITWMVKNPPEGNIRGLEHKLSQLLTLTPKDKNGRFLFDRWKRIFSDNPQQSVLKTNDFSVDVTNPDFPGLTRFIESIEKQILLDAKKHLKTNRAVAKFLKLSDGAISIRLKQFAQTHINTGGEQ